MEDQSKLAEIRAKLVGDPGSEEFVELARLLIADSSSRAEAREACFRGLNANPRNLVGRLLLARLFYLDGLGEFCVRELIELSKYCDAPSIKKLLDGFGDYAKPFISAVSSVGLAETSQPQQSHQQLSEAADGGEKVVAEIDLDFSEALDELEQ
jgi:hypothetical protein